MQTFRKHARAKRLIADKCCHNSMEQILSSKCNDKWRQLKPADEQSVDNSQYAANKRRAEKSECQIVYSGSDHNVYRRVASEQGNCHKRYVDPSRDHHYEKADGNHQRSRRDTGNIKNSFYMYERRILDRDKNTVQNNYQQENPLKPV